MMNESCQEERKKKKKHKKHKDKDRDREHHHQSKNHESTGSVITDEHSSQCFIEQTTDNEAETITKSLKIKFKFGQTTTTSSFSPVPETNSVPVLKINLSKSPKDISEDVEDEEIDEQLSPETVGTNTDNLKTENIEGSLIKKDKKDKKSKKHKHKKHKHHKSKPESTDKLVEDKNLINDLKHDLNEAFSETNVMTAVQIEEKSIFSEDSCDKFENHDKNNGNNIKNDLEMSEKIQKISIPLRISIDSKCGINNEIIDKPPSIDVRTDTPSPNKHSNVPELKLKFSKFGSSSQYSLMPSPQSDSIASIKISSSQRSSPIPASPLKTVLQIKTDPQTSDILPEPESTSPKNSDISSIICASLPIKAPKSPVSTIKPPKSPIPVTATAITLSTLQPITITTTATTATSTTSSPRSSTISPKISSNKSKNTPGRGFNALLQYLHKQLQKKDSEGFFADPVSDSIAPSYSTIITHPMDLSTINKKIQNHQYSTLGDFRADVKLMIDNAMKYNRPDTIYYKAAAKLWNFNKQKLLKKDALTDYAKHYELSPHELSLNLSQKCTSSTINDANKTYSFDNTGLFMDPNRTSFTAFVPDGNSTSNDKDPWTKLLHPEPFLPFNLATATNPSKPIKINKEKPIFCDGLTKDQYFSSIKAAAKRAQERCARKRNYFTFITQESSDSIIANIRDDHAKQTYRQEIPLDDIYCETKDSKEEPEFVNIFPPTPRLTTQSDSSNNNVAEDNEKESIRKQLIPIYGNNPMGLDYALSIAKFSMGSSYASSLVTPLLDVLTGGKHRTVQDSFNKLLQK